MAPTIFYSWQSDTPSKTNRRFIKECLEEAVKQLVADGHVEEAPRVDHDTKDVPGDPDVFPTILKKIDECDIFVADITIVAATEEGKNIPNPNVLLELGYAYNATGSGRIIKIMNGAYGNPEKGLPFDLAHKRWPYSFTLPANAEKAEIEKMKQKVAKDLAEFVRQILAQEGARGETLPVFSEIKPVWNSSSFVNDGILGIYEHRDKMPIQWENGPQWFLRVIPANGLKEITTRRLLEYILNNGLHPFGKFAGISKMVNEWGAVSFEQWTGGKPIKRISQLFRSGELWGIENANDYCIENSNLSFQYLVNVFKEGLEGYLSFMRDKLELSPPLKVIAGVSGIAGFTLFDPRFTYEDSVGHCPQNEVLHELILNTFEVNVEEIFSPLFQKLWEEFTLPGIWKTENLSHEL